MILIKLLRKMVNVKLTVVHFATLEARACCGIFKVIWDNILWPNMRNPITATPPYIRTQNTKLPNINRLF